MKQNPTLATKDATDEAKREAARLMGSIKTEKKAEASRRNGFKPGHPGHTNGGRKVQPLYSLECTCGAGDTTEGHKWNCPRSHAIKRRLKEGRDVLSGELLPAVAS